MIKLADPILSKRSLDKYLSNYEWNEEKLEEAQKTFKKWAKQLDGVWANTKETELTSPFYNQVLINILGYKEGPADTYTIGFENRTTTSAKKPDVVLGNFTSTNHSQPDALIEFESPYTPLDAPDQGVDQAFSYQSQYDKPVRWIIASNFREIRIYDSTREHMESFNIKAIANDTYQLKKFYFFLSAQSIVNHNKLKKTSLEVAIESNVADQKAISDKFYDDYIKTRQNLIDNILQNNPSVDNNHAFTYAQKILDRFIFIAFAQDYNLIPSNTFQNVITVPKATFNRYPIWTQMKELFHAIDQGWPEKHINHFNGGLFKPDPEIDELGITDDIFEFFKLIDDYDFKSDLSVNLLGHIFEQAINDIDAAKNNNTNSSKRKHDGIFYTPSSITSYLLNETLQSWLNDAYDDLKIDRNPSFTDKDYEEYRKFYISSISSRKTPNKRAKAVSKYVTKLEKLKDRIKSIKIVDPAVGSGSFLIQALESLKSLLEQIQNTIDGITLQPTIPTPDTDILSNNLFGVDINQESVEIAKLSLWLRTANKHKPLTTLDNNLKVGDSIINDKLIKPNAFLWGQEFPTIFKKNSGFDILLGNPPYVSSSGKISNVEKKYYRNNYVMSEYQENLYRIFTEKGFNLLTPGGWFGFIVPNTWFSNKYFSKMRHFLFTKTNHLKIIGIQDKVFEDASVDTSLIIFKKPKDLTKIDKKYTIGMWKNNSIIFENYIDKPKSSNNIIVIKEQNKLDSSILQKMENGYPISTFLKDNTAKEGVKIFQRGKGHPKQPLDKDTFNKFKKNNDFFSTIQKDSNYYPFVEPNGRYIIPPLKKYIKYTKELAEPRKFDNFVGKHILLRTVPNKGKYACYAALFKEKVGIHERSTWDLQPKDNTVNQEFLLGVINSVVTSYWLIMQLGVLSRSTYPQLRKYNMNNIRIPNCSTRRQNLISNYVNDIQKLIYQKREVERRLIETINISLDQSYKNISTLNIDKIKRLAKKHLKVSERADFVSFYVQQVNELQKLKVQINEKDNQIDNQVIKAFNFTMSEKEHILDTMQKVKEMF